MKSVSSIERRLFDLPKLDRTALEHQYKRLHGKEVSEESSDELLRMSVAYRLQQQLTARLRSRMYQALTAAEAITSLVIEGSSSTILLGHWKGTVYEVTVLNDGAMYRGDYYDCLDKIVYLITGGKKSVEEFFGQARAVSSHGH